MIRRASTLALICLAGRIAVADALYSNGSPDATTPALGARAVTLSGVRATMGAMWSECAGASGEADHLAGFSAHPESGQASAGSYRLADDFEVTSPNGWRVTGLSFFAYSPGATEAASPFAGVSVRIWAGRPGDHGVLIAYGDATTNRLSGSEPTGTYRVFHTLGLPSATAPDTSRLIWRLDADGINTFLAPGRYWLEWQITCVDPDAGAYVPAVTVPGSRGSSGANALHFTPQGLAGAWVTLIDPGKPELAHDAPQELPFLVRGEEMPAPCPADFNQDGGVDGADIEYFFRAWAAADPRSDVNLDGGVDGSDVETFFLVWEQGGC
ncbi:MAG: hypothetical protein JNK25_03080 [Phycisphaerae bacterium]|nr:hypothetical protein [Phycisphaerae bacterium]